MTNVISIYCLIEQQYLRLYVQARVVSTQLLKPVANDWSHAKSLAHFGSLMAPVNTALSGPKAAQL